MRTKYRLVLIVFMLFFMGTSTLAAQSMKLPVNWQQDNIGWNDLQSIFDKNPGYAQFAIHFPNGYNWNVDAMQLRSVYTQYIQHANALGFAPPNIPKLLFSSVKPKTGTSGGVTTVSLHNFAGDMNAVSQKLLDELDYQKMEIARYLPDWLKDIIIFIYTGFMHLRDLIAAEIKKWI